MRMWVTNRGVGQKDGTALALVLGGVQLFNMGDVSHSQVRVAAGRESQKAALHAVYASKGLCVF